MKVNEGSYPFVPATTFYELDPVDRSLTSTVDFLEDISGYSLIEFRQD